MNAQPRAKAMASSLRATALRRGLAPPDVERLIAAKIARTGCSREDVIAGWTGAIPAGRLGEADELAALIVFLMSRQAGYITGQAVVADGGWVRATC